MDEPVTIEERYGRAQNSSNLSVKADARGDADILLAAGMSPGMLGHALIRLHGEWDAAAKPAHIAQTDATLLYGRLKSLQKVLGILSEYLSALGDDKPLIGAKQIVMYWLDPRCQHCGGRGADLLPGAPVLGKVCRHCRGSKKRREPLGERGRRALNMMDEAVMRTRQSMRARLRNF